ncbi:alpha-hydroxy acid oxidase [Palleronia sp. LCG004]|uniref:alpha-hydroxy acid oxidase n=1 Tax=Palleronia sp. LCG004 TaxID=3079304 RepID=UPI0029439872|nr:alpha-hydroxy acid oxidase [Palleronia sp. LCG004]WOI55335.1 alpha-hydroxy acid oxidase [Palleronia sp. LCG004]
MDLDDTHPALSDLAAHARKRVPHFIWEYLQSATGDESSARRSAEALDRITLVPRNLRKVSPDLGTTFLGQRFDLPFGIAPVGMSGSVWPGAEAMLARSAARNGAPFSLSTVAAMTPEAVGPHLGTGWFQLYAPGDPEIRRDMLKRARDAGFTGLILTVDVQTPSRRERQRRARLTNPMQFTPRILWQTAQAPFWALAIVQNGVPKLRTLEKYAGDTKAKGETTSHIGYMLRTAPDWEYLAAVRDEWDGPLMVKGVLSAEDAARATDLADAVWISNHGGRQFEAAPAPVDVLPAIRQAVGPDYPLIADGAVRSGTDILRLIAKGADYVMLGRAFHHGAASFGERGVDHVFHILREGLKADMGQLGISRPEEVRDHLG